MTAVPDDDGDRQEKTPDDALERLTERVREVQDLQAFEATRREDGRFTFELQKPLVSLSPQEAREAAEELEKLAELVRRAGSG